MNLTQEVFIVTTFKLQREVLSKLQLIDAIQLKRMQESKQPIFEMQKEKRIEIKVEKERKQHES